MCAPFALAAQWSADQRQALTEMAVGEQIQLTLPEASAATRFERIDVYAAGARVWVVDEQGKREIPRSPWLHYIAQDGSPAAFSMDPANGRLEGMRMVDGQAFVLSGQPTADGGLTLDTSQPADRDSEGQPADWACSDSPEFDDGLPEGLKLRSLRATSAVSSSAKGAPASRQAVVAVDTDTELLALKFSGSTTNASNYIASLFTLMNGIYEMSPGAGGLDLRVVQGDTFLRTGSDPYSQSGGNAQLNEFSEFWRVNQGGIQRAFAMLLSGKSSNANSASGIAWVLNSGNYCSSTGQVFGGGTFGHYSASQVFRFNGSTAASDLSLIAHELGHNFGASHSHCTSVNGNVAPTGVGTMDQCFGTETSCYSGSVSCPAGGSGSLMSYCHFSVASGGPNCGAAMTTFHPGHVTNLTGRIASNFPGCITPLSATGPIFEDGFE